MGAGNMTLYARWTGNPFTVTFDGNGGGTPSPTSKTVAFDSPYGTLATVSRTDYFLTGWYTAQTGGSLVTDTTLVTNAADHTLYAHWIPICIATTNADGGQGSLRWVIANCPNSLLTFDNSLSGQTIRLASPLTLAQDVIIDGSYLGATITLSGDTNNDGTGDVQVFTVNSGVTVTLKNLTLSEGAASTNGGGIYNAGTLTVTNSTFSGNSASTNGGGIYNAGTLTVINSTFSGNSASTNGGGIYNAGTLTVINSTFSGNSASTSGGGVYNAGGTANLKNTILSSNSGGNCAGAITDGGNNIDDGTTCGFGTADGSLSSTNPQLGALTGSPAYFPLNSNSPAIDGVTDNIPNSAPATDQRGLSRPQAAGYDIGAYEVLAHTVTFDANTGSGSMSAQTSARPANLTANAFTKPGYTFTNWATQSGGGGTTYADQANYDFSADPTLYAQWTLNTYTLTYTAGTNGSITGTSPQTVNHGAAARQSPPCRTPATTSWIGVTASQLPHAPTRTSSPL